MPQVTYSNTLILVPPTNLHANPDNPRTSGPGDVTELAKSVSEDGILEPLLVRSAFDRFGPDHYIIDAGERRWTVGRVLALDLPCRVGTLDDGVDVREHTLVTGLVENGHRSNLNPVERAKAYDTLMKQHGYSQVTLAVRLGIGPGAISRSLSLLTLAPKTLKAVEDGSLSVADAHRLITVHRQDSRKKTGKKPAGRPEAIPPHFGPNHFLARRAKRLCDGTDHDGARVLLHGVACELHWERVIRDDEAKVQQAAARDAGFDIPFSSPEMAAAGNNFGHHRGQPA